MKIILPDNQNDITLGQYQKLMKLDKEADNYNDLLFCLFTGIDISQIGGVKKKDKDEVLNHINNALDVVGEFKNTFTLDNINFGFIPNLDGITGDEYSDLVKYSNEVSLEDDLNIDELHRLIAVLYRPIKSKDGLGNYLIEDYNGTSGHCDIIKQLPMAIVSGCLSFFLSLSIDLDEAIQRFTEVEQVKELTH